MQSSASLHLCILLSCFLANYVEAIKFTCPTDTITMPKLVVETSKGQLQGNHLRLWDIHIGGFPLPLRDRADVFRGIPYAKPPVGDRRLRPPEEEDSWSGVRDATKYGHICPQPTQKHIVSEDCLTLNVFTSHASPSKHYSVMVWIHGGGYEKGSGSEICPVEIITNLVTHGVVVVTLNYRVGFLGFFTTKTDDYPANLGLLDQVAALKWIQREIHHFGGDPTKVTIFGASAGGYSADFHTYSPMSRGLFSKAIMQSGTSRMPLALDGNDFVHNPSKQAAMDLCHITSNEWDTGDFTKLQTCLREASWQDMVHKTHGDLSQGWNVWPAVVHGPFLPDWPANLAKYRNNSMPIIIGTAHDEMALNYMAAYIQNHSSIVQLNEQYYLSILQTVTSEEQYGAQTAAVRRMVDEYYRPHGMQPAPHDHIGWMKLLVQLESDKYFFAPALHQGQEWLDVNHNPNVYMYSFDYASHALSQYYPPGYQPVVHSEESIYLFVVPIWNFTLITAGDVELIVAMGSMWTNFAKHGTPTPPPFPFRWLPLSDERRSNYLTIKPFATTQPYYWPEAAQLWNHRVPQVAHPPPSMK